MQSARLWDDCEEALEPSISGQKAFQSLQPGEERLPHLDSSDRCSEHTQSCCEGRYVRLLLLFFV